MAAGEPNNSSSGSSEEGSISDDVILYFYDPDAAKWDCEVEEATKRAVVTLERLAAPVPEFHEHRNSASSSTAGAAAECIFTSDARSRNRRPPPPPGVRVETRRYTWPLTPASSSDKPITRPPPVYVGFTTHDIDIGPIPRTRSLPARPSHHDLELFFRSGR